MKPSFATCDHIIRIKIVSKPMVLFHQLLMGNSRSIGHDKNAFAMGLQACNALGHTFNSCLANIENTERIKQKDIHLISDVVKRVDALAVW